MGKFEAACKNRRGNRKIPNGKAGSGAARIIFENDAEMLMVLWYFVYIFEPFEFFKAFDFCLSNQMWKSYWMVTLLNFSYWYFCLVEVKKIMFTLSVDKFSERLISIFIRFSLSDLYFCVIKRIIYNESIINRLSFALSLMGWKWWQQSITFRLFYTWKKRNTRKKYFLTKLLIYIIYMELLFSLWG